ncbi:hypothetical protein WK90_35535 [Burkholderia cepacia]|nr:hypothetical protein WK85_02985 [Burkholderia cepacia]KVV63783.1 hypothetical protein WK83_07590 [Burkholderia cepacia]KVV73849.1 hypothetical protein WK84_08625 [Burkholderia cepacia]KVV78966.1 hypothetical protein WK86_24720 [Burkholderia cepacia]KVV83950.1 hypothetical protein WK87_01595 [Burkholderia cepacia]
MSFSKIFVFARNQKHLAPKILSAFFFGLSMRSKTLLDTLCFSDVRDLLLSIRFITNKNVQTGTASLMPLQKIC